MRKQTFVLTALFFCGVSGLLSAGCANIPADVAKSVADVDSDTQALGADFSRVLDGYVPTAEEKAHWKSRASSVCKVSSQNAFWVQNHKKE